jgi:uncharacterized membrane protein
MLSDASRQSLRRLLWFGLALYGVVMAASFWVWAQLPADALVPIHYGLNFQPDSYAHKDLALLGLPQVVLLIALLMFFIPRFEPRRLNLENSMKPYVRVSGAVLLFLALMALVSAYNALSHTSLNASFFALVLGLMFAFIGNYMGKVRSTFLFGFRTPWTLSSDLAWNKTHRLAGKLFVICGLEMFLGGLLFNHPLVLYIGVGGVILSSLYCIVYSYFVWKADPNKRGM